jgi:branched-chain amino acid transport system substrate-binding protein
LIKQLVIKTLDKSPDVVFIGSLLPSVGNTIRELRINNFKGEIITNNTFSYSYINEISGDYGKGTIYQEFPETKKFQDFKKIYKEKFGEEAIALSVMCYDGLSYYIESWKTVKEKDPSTIISLMTKTNYNGLYGEIGMINREIKYPTYAKRW